MLCKLSVLLLGKGRVCLTVHLIKPVVRVHVLCACAFSHLLVQYVDPQVVLKKPVNVFLYSPHGSVGLSHNVTYLTGSVCVRACVCVSPQCGFSLSPVCEANIQAM
jgi:hypothetical protein